MEMILYFLIFLIFKFSTCQQPTEQLIKIKVEVMSPDGLIISDSKQNLPVILHSEPLQADFFQTTNKIIGLFKKCLPGYFLYGNSCYMIRNDLETLSYDLAQASCNSLQVIGSKPSLVSISTKDELDFVNYIIKSNPNAPTSVMIGLKLDSKYEYTWVDGSSLDLKNWCPDKPSTDSSNQCVVISNFSCFSDSPCLSRLPNQAYICEYDLPTFDKKKLVQKGESGPKGDPGSRGEKGDQGNNGEKGEKGENGQKGEKGEIPRESIDALKSQIGFHDAAIENLNAQIVSHEVDLNNKNLLIAKLGEALDSFSKRSDSHDAIILHLKEEIDKITTNDDQIFKFLVSIASLLDSKIKRNPSA